MVANMEKLAEALNDEKEPKVRWKLSFIRVLKAKPYWSVKEAMRLIKELFGVNYSDEQTRRILVEKLGMNYAKPFVRDYRRPKMLKIFSLREWKGQ